MDFTESRIQIFSFNTTFVCLLQKKRLLRFYQKGGKFLYAMMKFLPFFLQT